MHSLNEYFKNCLFFSAGALYRSVMHLAEQEFAVLGLSPSHAFLMMLVLERPGISPGELASALHLAPSTVSRLVDALVRKGLVEKESKPRSARVTATSRGASLADDIEQAWKRLYHRYSDILGEEQGRELTQAAYLAHRKLEN